MKPTNQIDRLIRLAVKNHTPEELALGWLRYEAVRKRNLSGEDFDGMADAVMDQRADPLSCHVVETQEEIRARGS